MTRERGEIFRNVKEQKRATLSATNGNEVAGLAGINSFWTLRDARMDRTGDRRVGRKTIDSLPLGWRCGEKVGRKGEGPTRANRLSSRGLRASRPGIPPSLFLPSLHHFFLYLHVSFSPDPILVLFVPVTSIRDNAELSYAANFRSLDSKTLRRRRTINYISE